jgi:RNA polymerase sigma-70 factor, ECF subfamily
VNQLDKQEVNYLIIEIKKSNDLAYEKLYGIMAKSVCSLAFSILKDKYLAEDATHETFIRVKSMSSMYIENTNGVAWILTLTRNLCLNILKKRKQETSSIINMDFYKNNNESFENSIEKYLLREALNKLNKIERNIVLLYSISGLKHREISSILEIPRATERWYYFSAIKKLKIILERSQKCEG